MWPTSITFVVCSFNQSISISPSLPLRNRAGAIIPAALLFGIIIASNSSSVPVNLLSVNSLLNWKYYWALLSLPLSLTHSLFLSVWLLELTYSAFISVCRNITLTDYVHPKRGQRRDVENYVFIVFYHRYERLTGLDYNTHNYSSGTVYIDTSDPEDTKWPAKEYKTEWVNDR